MTGVREPEGGKGERETGRKRIPMEKIDLNGVRFVA